MDTLISSFRNIRLLPTFVVIRHKRASDELSECELGQAKISRNDPPVESAPIEPVHLDEEHIREPPTLRNMSVDDDTAFLPFPRNMSCDSQHRMPHHLRPEHVIIDMSGVAY
jgi:hypothetical protein